MSRTLAMDDCHELCLLHLSGVNSIRHALIELTSLLDNKSLCQVSQATSSSHQSLRWTLMVGLSRIIQRVDHRPSTTSFCTSRFFALSMIHHDHFHLFADFTEMLSTHLSRDRPILHLPSRSRSLRLVLEIDEAFRRLDFL